MMGRFLGPIMRYCEENDLPTLTVLVVNQSNGLPGSGLETTFEVDRDRKRVFKWDWFDSPLPL